MFEFINDQQLKEIANAIFNNQDYSFDENGLSIQAKSSENGYSIQMMYSEPKEDLVKKEVDNFEDWLRTIDDDIFTGVCESMGGEEISKISNCLKSEDIESVRAGISKFKSYLHNYLNDKIDFYKQCSAKLLK